MQFTPRPITAEDKVDQSRDVAGLNKWAQSSRTISFIMFVLGWFTIPAEVILRRDFGQRWFTAINFYAGLFMLLIFATLQYLWSLIAGWVDGFIAHVASSVNPMYTAPDPSFADRVMDKSMVFLLLAYIVLGSYHRFKIWWRNRTNTALHSFHDGNSRLEPLASYFIQFLNGITVPFVRLYMKLLPSTQTVGVPTPKLINDQTAFTNTVLDPLVLLFLAYWLPGLASIWLFISAIALAIHANWKETAKLNKVLDFRDSVIEAKVMMQLKDETLNDAPSVIMQQAAETIKGNPKMAPAMTNRYPDLMNIIEEMNTDGGHLGNQATQPLSKQIEWI